MKLLVLLTVLVIVLPALLLPNAALAQATYTAQLRGTVKDSTRAVVPKVAVTVTNDGTKVSKKEMTDEVGRYIFNGLQPASYTVKVEAAGFRTIIHPNVVLRVGLQIDLDLTLELGEITDTVNVTAEATLLNSVSAALGTEVTNRYIMDMPLIDRDISNLSFLAPGVTEVQGAGIGYLGGTNFVSNGQRNGTAEFRADGALISSPEGGEGSNTSVRYKPLIEDVQEFKLQNNSFSAEFGNNGGTVVNIVTKSGTNDFHGSGWYFFRRPSLDANDFFSNREGATKGDYQHDQYGGAVGGPIIKQKTFFFADFEKIRDNSPFTITNTVPTEAQRRGDFSQTFNDDGTLQQIFNPYDAHQDADGNWIRSPFPGNIIPPQFLNPISVNVVNLYPQPTGSGDPVTGRNNFTKKLVGKGPSYQTDIKIDHNLNDKNRFNVRFSKIHYTAANPAANDSVTLGSTNDTSNIHNVVIAYNWTPTPTTLWTTQVGVDRLHEANVQESFDFTTVGFPANLNALSGLQRLPAFTPDEYGPIVGSNCNDTVEAHTQWMINSSFSKVVRGHNLKFGGEQRHFFNNFWQPCDPNGTFFFHRNTTMQDVFNPDDSQGNALASVLTGFSPEAWMGTTPPTSNKSKDTGFFVQDDWKVSQRLTVNLGLRYEWSTPYTERFDRLQWSDFSGDSGIDVPGLGTLRGITQYAGPGHRTIKSDRNNFGPRLGFAYRLGQKTVLRGGFGVYYGFNPATNFQYVGRAFNKDVSFNFSKDGGITTYPQCATCQALDADHLLPLGFTDPPLGAKSGPTARWGFENSNNLSDTFRSAEIYQWNIGIQRELPGNILLDVNYSASRSTHLPWHGGTRNRNFISRENRETWGSDGLAQLVPNPLQFLFQGAGAIINDPSSIYNDPEVPRQNLLRPFPQFDGEFAGLPEFVATTRFNSLQVRFEKRYSHGLNFTGQYTFSQFLDTSSEGANPWIGNLQSGDVQDPNNLAAEKSVSANDTPHRLAFAVSYDLPVGRGKVLGKQMNRAVDAVIGGWKVNGILTFQSGTPIDVAMDFARLADGRQRPNVSGNPRSNLSIKQVVDGRGDPAFSFFNDSVFSDPGDQIAGNSPRYFSDVRGPGIHNLDLSIFKSFAFREGMYLQVRAEFSNFTNTPRFGLPNTSFGSSDFGTIQDQYNGPRRGQVGLRFVF